MHASEKLIKILAWLFTAIAVALAILVSATGAGGELCALFMTFALFFQYCYGRRLKREAGMEEETSPWRRGFSAPSSRRRRRF